MAPRRPPKPTPEIKLLDAADRLATAATLLIQARPPRKVDQRRDAFKLIIAGALDRITEEALVIVREVTALRDECGLFREVTP